MKINFNAKTWVILLILVLIIFVIIYIQIGNSEEEKDYCEEDSDCYIRRTCCCYEALNKKFIKYDYCIFKRIQQCEPCPWILEKTTVKCVNNKCILVEKTK